MVIAIDISKMDEDFGSPCFDFVISIALSGVSSMILNSKSPFLLFLNS